MHAKKTSKIKLKRNKNNENQLKRKKLKMAHQSNNNDVNEIVQIDNKAEFPLTTSSLNLNEYTDDDYDFDQKLSHKELKMANLKSEDALNNIVQKTMRWTTNAATPNPCHQCQRSQRYMD